MPDRTPPTVFTTEKVHIENYNLEAHYCRQLHEKGGVVIFVHNSLCFSNIEIVKHCVEQDIVCALKLSFGTLYICVLTLYEAPSGIFSIFLTQARHYSTITMYTYDTLHYLWGHKH